MQKMATSATGVNLMLLDVMWSDVVRVNCSRLVCSDYVAMLRPAQQPTKLPLETDQGPRAHVQQVAMLLR